MPRFVLLYHDCPPGYVRPSHWDLMLEAGDALETWALAELPRDWGAAHAHTVESYPNCPSLASDNTVSAEHLADHRLAYLEYEGPISGGRGNEFRVAASTYTLQSRGDDAWDISIDAGPILSGDFALKRTSPGSVTWHLASRPKPRSSDSD